MLTIAQTSKITGATYWQIRRLIHDGLINATKVGGKYYVDPADLDKIREYAELRNSHGDLIPLGRAAADVGVHPNMLRKLAATGKIRSKTWQGRCHKITYLKASDVARIAEMLYAIAAWQPGEDANEQ